MVRRDGMCPRAPSPPEVVRVCWTSNRHCPHSGRRFGSPARAKRSGYCGSGDFLHQSASQRRISVCSSTLRSQRCRISAMAESVMSCVLILEGAVRTPVEDQRNEQWNRDEACDQQQPGETKAEQHPIRHAPVEPISRRRADQYSPVPNFAY